MPALPSASVGSSDPRHHYAPVVADESDLAAGLYRDPRNTARQTRARFEYQDACIVFRCIPNLLHGSPVEAVVVEWATDYVLLGRDGGRELVSVKHRDPGQHDWTFGRLKAENVFRDLHSVWRAMGEAGDYAFESNAGFEPALAAFMGNPGERRDPGSEAAAKLAALLQIDLHEARKFLGQFFLRQDPLPGRQYIGAVAIQNLAVVLKQLSLDETRAYACFAALTARVADASTQRPPEPVERVSRLVGFMRDIEHAAGGGLADHILTMEELREIVALSSRPAGTDQAAAKRMIDDPLFVGRDRQLAELAERLSPGSAGAVAPVVLTGMPGIGKTALASRFAAQHGTELRVYVVPADTRTALVAAAHTLNPLPADSQAPLATGSLAAAPVAPAAPSLPDDAGLLIIVDGLTDPAVVEGIVARLSRTKVIITATCVHVDDAFHHIAVNGLTSAEGIAYLRLVLSDALDSELAMMFEAFDGHPLGLAQGANYCRIAGLLPSEYIERLRQAPARMLELGHSPGHPLPVRAAIETAIAAATAQNQGASAVADMMASLAPDPVPTWLFNYPPLILERDDSHKQSQSAYAEQHLAAVVQSMMALSDPINLDAAIIALHQYGLVERMPAGLRMHPLIQTVIRERAPQEQRFAWIEATLGLLLPYLVRDSSSSADFDLLTPHAAACVEAAAAAGTEPLATCSVLSWLGNRHYYFGALEISRHYLERALALAEEAGLPSQVIFTSLHDLTRTYRTEGNTTAALSTIETWMARAKDADEDREYYEAHRAYANTLSYAERFPEADRALASLREETPSDLRTISDQIMELSLVADVERGRGQSREALSAVDAALELASQVESGPRRSDHLAALHAQAAKLQRDLGNGHKAVDHQRKAVDAARSLDIGIHFAYQLHGLASRLLDLDIGDEAAQVISEGMALAAARGNDSPLRGAFLQEAGRLALLRKEWKKAKKLFTDAIRLLTAGGEPVRADLAAAHFNLATAQVALKEFRSAANSAQTARDIDAAIYSDDHPELVIDELKLAETLYTAGDLNAARKAIGRCLGIVRQGAAQGPKLRTEILAVAVAIDLDLGLRPSS